MLCRRRIGGSARAVCCHGATASLQRVHDSSTPTPERQEANVASAFWLMACWQSMAIACTLRLPHARLARGTAAEVENSETDSTGKFGAIERWREGRYTRPAEDPGPAKWMKNQCSSVSARLESLHIQVRRSSCGFAKEWWMEVVCG